jgi:glycerophosphoryl diester phosphodiesterase
MSILALFVAALPGLLQAVEPQLPVKGICAHRGASVTHPENTLPAFREAIRLGAHMIEFDVQLSKDSALVVIHDASVDRTSDGKGKVADLTLARLKQLDAGSWKSPEFKNARIPTLAEVLGIMPENIWLNVHLKGGGATGKRVAESVLAYNRQRQAFLACGAEAARAARRVDTRILICNMDRQSSNALYIEETIKMGADFIQLKGSVSEIRPKLIQRLKEAEVKINYFGTNDPAELLRLYSLGVEFPLVDDLQPMLAASRTVGLKPVKPVYGSNK